MMFRGLKKITAKKDTEVRGTWPFSQSKGEKPDWHALEEQDRKSAGDTADVGR
jgi:hypothetical protein